MQEVLRPLQTLTAHTAALWAPLVHDGCCCCCCLRLAPWLSTGPSWSYTWTYQHSMGSRLKWVHRRVFLKTHFFWQLPSTSALCPSPCLLLRFLFYFLSHRHRKFPYSDSVAPDLTAVYFYKLPIRTCSRSNRYLLTPPFPEGSCSLSGVLKSIGFSAEPAQTDTGCRGEKHLPRCEQTAVCL